MKLNMIALSLAALYVIAAFIIALQDFNCGGGLDINFCGLGTLFFTFPSYLTVGRLFLKIGLEIDFGHRTPSVSDFALLTTHIIICAIIVYFIAVMVQLAISRLRAIWR